MSACMRSLYSSDQWAPGLCFPLSRGRKVGGFSLSAGAFRVPLFNLSVARDEVELTGGFESFMRWMGAFCRVVMNLVQEGYQTLIL